MTTIKDIAEHAKVSPATVSRILNYDDKLSVSDETRQRVFKIAEEMNYQKKKLAKYRLKKKKIAIVQWHSNTEELGDLFYMQIQYGIEAKAHDLKFASTVYSIDQIIEKIDFDSSYIGIIAVGKFDHTEITALSRYQLPIVFIGVNTLGLGFDCVNGDYTLATRQIIDYFFTKKITDIGLLIGIEHTKTEKLVLPDPREQTYKTYLEKLGYFNDKLIFAGDFTPQSGYNLMQQAITELGTDLPHGFIIGNDTMAIGAIHALQEADIKIPERVSLISFNDISIAQFTNPTLSTVHAYTETLGENAVSLLLERVAEPDAVPHMLTFASKLILRASSL
ncbi:LacI family DNA-binding transcriptional regulator [Loigolactobacillus jiayinensis]|uniref:LacI family DNA-binding transcriptional regulator n=1 Tax=Loigolactobacillus jiayinensis TaxID=2486016 RepID=A0ABW1REE0_9LACO|nr:LacI family DNA-binding transcriptional regulator [Loigolactobacillus jiayinensis]